ncbi:MAG: hypothetical protein VZR00_07965 [Lachnospiraceae bacterium]|nr:hypothetical protein [Lachnospiraceae bacterium]MEE3461802.1 hypothetical protein [Lachnospiraceae bacterium]
MEDYKNFYNTEIPGDIQNRIRNSKVTETEFKDKDDVLIRYELHKETGVAKCNDGQREIWLNANLLSTYAILETKGEY